MKSSRVASSRSNASGPSDPLKNALWGIPSDERQQLIQIKFYEARMADIIGKKFKQDVVDVIVAIQLLVLLRAKKNPNTNQSHTSKYYPNIICMMDKNHELVNAALHKIYKDINSDEGKDEFLSAATNLRGIFKENSKVSDAIMDFTDRVILVNDIREDFDRYLPPILYKFNSTTAELIIRVDNNRNLVFNLVPERESHSAQVNNTFYVRYNCNVHNMKMYIALKVMVQFIFEAYHISYPELLNLRYGDYCDLGKPNRKNNYQSANGKLAQFIIAKMNVKANEEKLESSSVASASTCTQYTQAASQITEVSNEKTVSSSEIVMGSADLSELKSIDQQITLQGEDRGPVFWASSVLEDDMSSEEMLLHEKSLNLMECIDPNSEAYVQNAMDIFSNMWTIKPHNPGVTVDHNIESNFALSRFK